MIELVLKYRLFIAGTNFALSGSQQLLQSRHVMMLIRDEQIVKRNSDGIHFTLVIALSLAILFYAIRKLDMKKDRSPLLLREQETTVIVLLDTAIEGWQLALKQPQLEEQTKREAAARQLSILLIEKLVFLRC